jgi:large subunit ribosomal protein L4e
MTTAPPPEPSSPPSPPAMPSANEATRLETRVISAAGKPGESVALPPVFGVPVRVDLIRRAVVALQSHRRQPHGTAPMAGLRHSVEWSGKGRGVARTPRLMDSMRGAQSPNTVGGRPAHPPRVETRWAKKMNIKERRLAFASALAATRDLARVRARGHRVEDDLVLPVVVEPRVEEIGSAIDAQRFLERLKIHPDIERARDGTHVRAGRGKRRGRYRREPKSVLVVTSAPGRGLGFRNLAGVDVVPVGRLSTEDLAPGGQPGRLTLYSRAALDALRGRWLEAGA